MQDLFLYYFQHLFIILDYVFLKSFLLCEMQDFTLLCATMLQMRTSVDIQDDDHKQYFAHFNPKEEKKEKRRYEKVD